MRWHVATHVLHRFLCPTDEDMPAESQLKVHCLPCSNGLEAAQSQHSCSCCTSCGAVVVRMGLSTPNCVAMHLQ